MIRFLSLVLVVVASTSVARAQDEAEEATPTLERTLGLGAYGNGWAGSYLGGGVGGRLRIEPFDWAGVDLFADHMWVDSANGSRHDHPIGFSLYTPIRLADGLRLRPLFGFCAVFSFWESEQEEAPDADDILFGLHGGIGIEWSPFDDWSLFADVQGFAYLGHDRTTGEWTGDVSEDLGASGLAQLSIGVMLHPDL